MFLQWAIQRKTNATQVRLPLIELVLQTPSLLKKKELVVLNKIDLIEEAKIKEIVNDLSKKVKKEIFILSTLQNKSVIKIKTKLISYVF